MTTIAAVYTPLPNSGSGKVWIITWPLLLNGYDGEPVELFEFQDRSIQIVGTAGAGFHCLIEGTNDNTNYATLHDPSMTTLDFTSTGQIKEVLEACRKFRPRVSAGDGNTSVTVTIFAKRTESI